MVDDRTATVSLPFPLYVLAMTLYEEDRTNTADHTSTTSMHSISQHSNLPSRRLNSTQSNLTSRNI